VHVEFVGVVAELVALFAQLDLVDVFGYESVVLCIVHPFLLLLHRVLDLLSLFAGRDALELRCEVEFRLGKDLLLRLGRDKSERRISRLVIRATLMSPTVVLETASSTAPITIALISLLSINFKSKELFFVLGDVPEKHIAVAKVDHALLCKVAVQARE